MFGPLFLLILLGGIGLYFLEAIKAREVAATAARKACEAEHLQFLDESVVQRKLRFARDRSGRLGLQRTFSFEYSDTGNNRLPGSVTVSALQVIDISTIWRSSREETGTDLR